MEESDVMKPLRTRSIERSPVSQGSHTPKQRDFTPKQGQYLAFIYYYTKIHGRSPAEADIRSYFKVSPPAVHQMILTLEIQGFIGRTPGQPRSIRLLLGRDHLPDLD